MQHLIEQNVIRFADGAWVLPQELSPHELPADIAQALDLRIARLSAEAQRLALALCVHRGTIAIDRCLALAELERVQSPFRALIELEQRGVLIASEDRLRFSHAAVREAALRRLPAAERRRLHAQLGMLISHEEGSAIDSLLDAGWHLLHGGQDGRGADLLAEAGLALSYDADDMPAAIPALEAALAVFRRQDRSKRELARLLGPLAIAGFYTDRRVAETYGDEAVAVMQEVLGLGLARRAAPVLGARASALFGLGIGLLRTLFAVGPWKLRSAFQEALMVFITAVCVLAGLGTITLDARRARRFARLLEPLKVLGQDHAVAVVHRFTEALTTLPEDRIMHTITSCRSALARFEDPRPIRDMPDKARLLLHGAALYACGSLETFREGPEALRIADQLETMGIKLFEMFANQIRATYHGVRGEERLAERYRKRVELFAVQAGSSWQAEVWTPASSLLYYMNTRDLIGLRRAADQLARLAQEIPSLRLHAEMAIAGCHMLRNDAESGRAHGHPLVAATEPRSHIGWGAMMAGEVWSLRELGDPEQARQLGRRVLELYEEDDRTASSMLVPILVQLALTEARLGEFEIAAERIDLFLAELGDRGGPATRGSLHEARIRIALAASDAIGARLHFTHMEQWFRPTENPALVARCEQLRREIEAFAPDKPPTSTLDVGLPPTEEVRKAVRECSTRKQRFERVLELLLAQTGGRGGQLFSYEDGRLVIAASRGQLAPEAVRDLLQRHLAQFQCEKQPDATESASGVTELNSGVASLGARSEEHRLFVLATCDGPDRTHVAAAVIAAGRRPLHPPTASMLAAMAEAILDHDPVTVSASR